MGKTVNIVLSGEAGEGLKTIEKLITDVVSKYYYYFATKEVMSRVRGGNNTTEIRISEDEVYAFQKNIDVLFLLNDNALYRLEERINEKTVIFGSEKYKDDKIIKNKKSKLEIIDLNKLADEAGNKLFKNTIIFGFLIGMMELKKEEGNEKIKEFFSDKKEDIINKNIDALEIGYKKGENHTDLFNIKKGNIENCKNISGTEAVGIGALAGGCNFVGSYPMSPATGVLTYLAGKGKEFDVLVEQAEDEIAALNMVIGSWYTGGRGLATTSGGGFALMQEAVSLSGVSETPCVVHIAQRPGPATGMPTRMEQGDLNLTVYAGHGEFPRIIVAPGTLKDGIELTQKAFYLADKYQVPAFILTDQFYVDSNSQMKKFELNDKYLEQNIVETQEDYKRYKITEDGISPRGIPGYGKGVVKGDSHEHTEEGLGTEDFNIRSKMNEKRMRKTAKILEDYIKPELIGDKDNKNLVVGWGSTYGVLAEFVNKNKESNTSFLNIKQLYPLHEDLKEYFEKAEKVIVVENNYKGQLANLLKLELDIKVDKKVLKYSGEPFSIEEIEKKLKEVL
ncbi:MAG: 2-oxoacid:acceptor oxidoreductase subunit alpha [Bacillota bacterium]|nr:2-oxoacid:acceptor oxidoreductase subunit alpha [Bacillota bacterium]